MKALFIGGTGNISSSVSELAVKRGIDLYHLNRGNRAFIEGVKNICADITDEQAVKEVLKNHTWDVVVNWIAFTPADIERDIRLFEGKTSQYIFISSASAYQKPPRQPIITENTPLENPFWDYSRQKIACENRLLQIFNNQQFPITIIRPSHTYKTVIPLQFGAWNEYSVIDRMKKGQPVIIPGDGTAFWTITHADDFAKGFVGLMGNNAAIGEAFHITSDDAMTWNSIYETVCLAAKGKANFVHIASQTLIDFANKTSDLRLEGTLLGDKSNCAIFDNSKIKRLVPDFNCTTPFAEGIQQTLNWFEAKPERMVINQSVNQLMDELVKRYAALF